VFADGVAQTMPKLGALFLRFLSWVWSRVGGWKRWIFRRHLVYVSRHHTRTHTSRILARVGIFLFARACVCLRAEARVTEVRGENEVRVSRYFHFLFFQKTLDVGSWLLGSKKKTSRIRFVLASDFFLRRNRLYTQYRLQNVLYCTPSPRSCRRPGRLEKSPSPSSAVPK